MEEEETAPILSRKEMRRQKLMEYLTAKGKTKASNPKLHPQDDCQVKKPVMSGLKVRGKENNAPLNSFRNEARKIQSVPPPPATRHPARKPFGFIDKGCLKSNILQHSSATSGPAQPKPNKNRVLTNTCSISSKSNLINLKHQSKAGMQSSVIASSTATCKAVAKPNSRFRSSSTMCSAPMMTVSGRISLGPIVKTKTGLVPAVIRPRNTKSDLICSSVTAAITSVANKECSNASSVSFPAKRKTLPHTALSNHIHEKTTVSRKAGAVTKIQYQKKYNTETLLDKHLVKPSGKIQPSSELKSMCRAGPVKPVRKGGKPENSLSAVQPIVRSTKQRSQVEGEKSRQPSRVAPRTSPGPASSSRVVGGVSRAAVAEPGGESSVRKKTEGRMGLSSAKNPPSQSGTKGTSAPVMSQTVPRPARTTEVKRPKVPVRVVPQTEVKKVTAAQEERMRKLQAWREAKGISYKRPPMPVKAPVKRAVSSPQPFWATMKEEDEVHSLIYAVERSLADCLKLLGEGCPTEQVKGVLSRLPPVSQNFAKYWICQARVMEREGNLDVLPVFEEAVRVVLEPVDELRTAVFEILKKKDEIQGSEDNEKEEGGSPKSNENPVKTPPEPVRALIWGEKGHSSVVKYKITATPRYV
ncbi:hypothetical protein PAMA_017963 [Pampus argenteus]